MTHLWSQKTWIKRGEKCGFCGEFAGDRTELPDVAGYRSQTDHHETDRDEWVGDLEPIVAAKGLSAVET